MSRSDRHASKINACRAVKRSTGVMSVYPPAVELESFRREHRAWRVVPLLCILGLVIFFAAVTLAGCAHLGAFGRLLEGAGDTMQKQPNPGVALAGVFVSLAGAAVAAIGKKYEKPIVTSAGVVAATFGVGAIGVQNAPLVMGPEPPAAVAPAEPGGAPQ